MDTVRLFRSHDLHSARATEAPPLTPHVYTYITYMYKQFNSNQNANYEHRMVNGNVFCVQGHFLIFCLEILQALGSSYLHKTSHSRRHSMCNTFSLHRVVRAATDPLQLHFCKHILEKKKKNFAQFKGQVCS